MLSHKTSTYNARLEPLKAFTHPNGHAWWISKLQLDLSTWCHYNSAFKLVWLIVSRTLSEVPLIHKCYPTFLLTSASCYAINVFKPKKKNNNPGCTIAQNRTEGKLFVVPFFVTPTYTDIIQRFNQLLGTLMHLNSHTHTMSDEKKR